MKEPTLTIEVIAEDRLHAPTLGHPRDVRLVWEGREYRRDSFRSGEPEFLLQISTNQRQPGGKTVIVLARSVEELEAWEHDGGEYPPLEQFVFWVPDPPEGADQLEPGRWPEPELRSRKVVE